MVINQFDHHAHLPDGTTSPACALLRVGLFRETIKRSHRLPRGQRSNWPVILRIALWFAMIIGLLIAAHGCAPTNDQWRVWNYQLRDSNYTLRRQLDTCIQPKGSER